MSYIILADSQKKQGEKVALVDRTKHKDQWWTENITKAIIFTSLDAAKIQCGKLKFNRPEVWTKEKGEIRLGQVRVPRDPRSHVSRMLDEKMQHWHDDDWDEGTNA